MRHWLLEVENGSKQTNPMKYPTKFHGSIVGGSAVLAHPQALRVLSQIKEAAVSFVSNLFSPRRKRRAGTAAKFPASVESLEHP